MYCILAGLNEKKFNLDESKKDYNSFKRKIYEGKKGIDHSLRTVISNMNEDHTLTPVIFLICFILKKDHHWKAQLDAKGQDLNK